MSDSLAAAPVPEPLGDDPHAVDERLAASLPRLRRHLTRGRHVPSAEADDVAQEALARALRYRSSFDPARGLWPWLRRLADRVLSDRRAERHFAPLSSLDARPDEPFAREDAGARLDELDEVARLLAPLAAIEREVLVRFHQRGQSVREIGAELGLPDGTVKSHLSRARRRLAGLDGKESPHA